MTVDPIEYLFSLEHFGIKFGLDNIQRLVAALGHPERAFRSVHVAGTNGKGSVTAMVAAMLQAAGHRSARYTSPHLVDLTERFVIDGEPVTTDRLRAVVQRVREAVQALQAAGALDVHPTFFEVTTAAAFALFRDAGVEVAVCEVGLGGRLDATNVLTPVVTAITSIGMDHEQYLGHSMTDIAVEKAGIIKPGVPVVVGDLDPPAAATISAIADERRAPLVTAREGATVERQPGAGPPNRFRLATPARDYGLLELGLAGDHQVDNALVAVRLVELLASQQGIPVPPDAVREGLRTVRWRGRLERIALADGRELLMDAAHNPSGAATLARYLSGAPAKPPLVFAAMRDKDLLGILAALAPVIRSIVLTKASHPRSADPQVVAELMRQVDRELPVTIEPVPARALAAAWQQDRTIVAAGSIFLLGDVLKELGRS